MLTQEKYMDVVALRKQGWTIGQIAESVGHHPATVSSWLKRGPPPRRGALILGTVGNPSGALHGTSERLNAGLLQPAETSDNLFEVAFHDPPAVSTTKASRASTRF
jgi:hypothetical protein